MTNQIDKDRELLEDDLVRSKYLLSESKRLGKVTTEISNERLAFLIAIAKRALEVKTCEGCEYWESKSGFDYGHCMREVDKHGTIFGQTKREFGCIHWVKKK